MTMITTPTKNTIEIDQGQAYIRYEGITYNVQLNLLRIQHTGSERTVEVQGVVVGK